MEEKKIIPKGKQELTDEELSRISGGEYYQIITCTICGATFTDHYTYLDHLKEHDAFQAPYNPVQPDIAPVK